MIFRRPRRQRRALGAERCGKLTFVEADVHAWDYPAEIFDVVMEILAEFSPPAEGPRKRAGMRRGLKPGGLLILQGYTPEQLQYGIGGPKQVKHLNTRDLLTSAFGNLAIAEEKRGTA